MADQPDTKMRVPMTPEIRDALRAEFKGTGYGTETETTWCLNEGDKRAGFVSFWSNHGPTLSKLLARLRSTEGVRYQRMGGGLSLHLPTSMVRGGEALIKSAPRGKTAPKQPGSPQGKPGPPRV